MEIVETRRGSKEMKSDHHAVIDIENPYVALVASVRNELETLETLYPLSGECIIHRVPENLRQLDEKAYTPRIVSIGPIHHGKEGVKAMELYKRRYLQNFFKRTEVRLEDFITFIKGKESEVRNCYEETSELNSDDFVKMVLMDAAFIFELLLMHFTKKSHSYDRIWGSPRRKHDVMDDLFMLENQLPFFILQDLFTLANISKDENSLLHITHELTKYRWDYLGIEDNFDESNYSEVKHLVDFLRICIVPSKLPMEKEPEILMTPSITNLHQAGVKFKLGSGKNLFDVRFRNGVLEIPLITIRSPMKYVLKNLLAFEKSQCEIRLLNHYVIFMNHLLNTPKDAELLIQHEIIHNPFGDSEQVTTLFRSLVERPTFNFNPYCFHFSSLVKELNSYCRTPWHKWKATLKQDYFKTPWTTVSVIAAVFLIILTSIQTVCSILQLQ